MVPELSGLRGGGVGTCPFVAFGRCSVRHGVVPQVVRLMVFVVLVVEVAPCLFEYDRVHARLAMCVCVYTLILS